LLFSYDALKISIN